MGRLSGLQQDVLSLYRRILREAMNKDRHGQPRHIRNSISDRTAKSCGHGDNDDPMSFLSLLVGGYKNSSARQQKKSTTTSYAASEFRKQALSVSRSEFKKVEYMIRKGEKQIKLLRMPGVKLVSGAHS
jgi:Complex 1 protein (LYR family)